MNDNSKQVNALQCIMLAALLLLLVWPGRARAETTVMVQPSSTGGLLVSAGNMYGVNGGEIRLDYITDGPTVAPNVTVLGNNVQASIQPSNSNIGTVIISITGRLPANGNYFLARIDLADQDGNPGRIIPPYHARFTRDKGGQETAQVLVTNPALVDTVSGTSGASAGKSPSTAEYIKMRQQEIALRKSQESAPGDGAGNVSPDFMERDRETLVLVASSQQSSPALSKTTPPVFRRPDGVLDRFRAHAGGWSPEVAERLFAPISSSRFRQEPEVLIADGNSAVKVIIRAIDMDDVVACFVVRGGQVSSVQQGQAGEWLLKIVPRQNALEASVTVQSEREITEYPLTVSPPRSNFPSGKSAGAERYLYEYVRKANELSSRYSGVGAAVVAQP